MGTGHVMRCLALAQAWQDAGGRAVFASAECPAPLAERLRGEGAEVARLEAEPGGEKDASATALLADREGARWVVADGYQFGGEYQSALKGTGLRLLFVDDAGHAGHYSADLVLNQNVYADAGFYAAREPRTRLLLGTRYALLRREFRLWAERRRDVPEVARRLLLTMGGGDASNVTLKALRGIELAESEPLSVTVLVGGGNPHHGELVAFAARSRHRVELKTGGTDVPELMAEADVALTGGGTTCLELALMGLPFIIFVLADNQAPGAVRLAEQQAAVNLGSHERVTPEQVAEAFGRLSKDASARAEMSRRGRSLVDGLGAERVVREIRRGGLKLRRAVEADGRLLWEWANEPGARAVSFSPESIAWETHAGWFNSKLNDPRCFLFVAENDEGEPVGQVRFDIDSSEAVISVSVDARSRGGGVGGELIRLGSRALFDAAPVALIHAYVKPDNRASVRAFEGAGYRRAGSVEVRGHEALDLVLQKGDGD
jgi:UDP-2,4-diacetamido-2,4,6-trideoxy-beta-L-altropyranose hydrolase